MQAFQFQKTSRKLKQAMFMRKLKIYAAIAFSMLLLIWIISAAACGIDYSKCRADDEKNGNGDEGGGDDDDDDDGSGGYDDKETGRSDGDSADAGVVG